MQIDQLLAAAAAQLAAAGVDDAALDARLLLEHLTGLSRSQLVLRGNEALEEPIAARYRQLVAQRARRVPLQYLTGVQEFWSLPFAVSPAVLIPRPETEFLLEQVLAACSGQRIAAALDLCTGSGVIAVVLARELGCPVAAVDISPAALAVAAANVARHRAAAPISLVCGDLFAPLRPGVRFDLIVSNPPYVAEEQIELLAPEVGRHEPHLALSGGPGGLAVIERIVCGALEHLKPDGLLVLEIGADQQEAVEALFASLGSGYTEMRVLDDWAGRPRVVRARRAQLP